MKPTLEEYWRTDGHLWFDAATLLGIDIDPRARTLNDYVRMAKIRYFTVAELTDAHVAGFPDKLVPPPCAWLAAVVLLIVADRLREAAGGPVKLRNWWRPEAYNKAVEGAARSDHKWACALDLDFEGFWARRRAQREVLMPLWRDGRYKLSIGVGYKTLHVGCFAPETLRLGVQRQWRYGSLPREEGL
jgi:hypothetical protein